MLFDDPIDDTGRLVSELKIPAEPDKVGGLPANKSPTSVDQVMEKPSGEAESTINGQNTSSASGSGSSDVATLDETEQSQASDINDTGTDSYAEEEMTQAEGIPENGQSKQDQEPGGLDTGIIEEANHSVKTDKITTANHGQTGSKPIPAKKVDTDTLKSGMPQNNTSKPLISDMPDEAKKSVNNTKVSPKKPDQQLVRWYLQAGSFGRKDNAVSLLESLRKQGIPVQLETVKSDKGALYRLKVGPELSKKRAVDMKAKLEKQKINALLIAE